jgi:leucyl/phenylalanyl-tRNA--protein transferase
MTVQSFTPPPSVFPSVTEADEHGLVAVSAEMDLSLLIDAYCNGIFPWTEEPVCWFSPNPRAIFELDQVRLPVRIGKLIRRYGYTITYDEVFTDVMKICAEVPRKHEGSWIGKSFLRDYRELYKLGYAHSVEVWDGDTLAGGLYGIQMGGSFSGESMFSLKPDASRIAFAALCVKLESLGMTWFDSQVLNDHTENLGAFEITRDHYIRRLKDAIPRPTEGLGRPWESPKPEKLINEMIAFEQRTRETRRTQRSGSKPVPNKKEK